MKKNSIAFLKAHWWIILFAGFLFVFAWKIFLKGYLIGPFDFLVGFYDPYYAIQWPSAKLSSMALNYKNNLLSDVVSVVLPPKFLAIQMIKEGQFPLWNQYQMNGTPLFASVQSAILYWANIFYFLFNSRLAYNIYILLQPFLAFVFMFLYLRNLKLSKVASYFGSLAFSFSAFFIVWLSWGTLGHAFLWLPLILYCCDRYIVKKERRYIFWYIFGLVSSFFAGHTQTSVMVFGTVFLYLLFLFSIYKKTEIIKLLVFFGVAVLITSIQLLPSYEMYQRSARELLAVGDFYKGQTLLFTSYLQIFFPDFFGNPVTRNWWGKINYAESAIYFGTTASFFLLYFFAGIRKKIERTHLFLIGVLLGGVILSTQNPLLHLVYNLKIPLLSSSTFSRYSALFIFVSSALAAFGFEYFCEDLRQKKFKGLYVVSSLCLLLIGIVYIAVYGNFLTGHYAGNTYVIKRNIILPSLIAVVLFLSFFWSDIMGRLTIFKPYLYRHTKVMPFFVILLLSLELLRFAFKYTPFSPPEFFYPPHSLISKLQEITEHNRYMQYFPPNVNSMYKIRGAEGKEPLQNLKVAQVASLGDDGGVHIFDRTGLQFGNGPYRERILDLFSVKYFVDKTDNFRNSWIDNHGKANDLFDKRFREIWTDGTFKIYQNLDVLDRHTVLYHEEVITNPSLVFKRLVSPNFAYKHTVITNKKLLNHEKNGVYSITIKKDNHVFQEYNVQTSEDGIFTVTDTYYPGWKVFVDGKETDLEQANYAFRGVKIPKGDHTVQFIYDPPLFKKGVLLSLAGVLMFIIYLAKPLWKK